MLKTETLAVQTVPKRALSYESGLHNPGVLAAALLAPLDEDEDILTTEQVAKVVAGVSPIGVARNALEQVGWNATIAGNRITVNDEVAAQFIGATAGPLRCRRRQVGYLPDRRAATLCGSLERRFGRDG
jgi:hypothetical protein